MAARPKVGDVIEFRTTRGYAYALYTHRHADFGALIRVWNEQRATPLREFTHLSATPPSFSTFYPLGAALRQSVAAIVGNIEVPPTLAQFPIFRAGIPDPATGKVGQWWLWDGEKEWSVGEITAEQRRLPIRGVWTHVLLKDRIESGWTPQTDRW